MPLLTISVVLVVLNSHLILTRDADVSCDFNKSCILPCSFQSGDDVVIHWIEVTADARAHSYYYKQDQLGLQDPQFKGRTSLFKEQLSRGNASLKLTGVEVQDEGRYKCYTSTISGNKEAFINLKVDAPVCNVNATWVENRITCSSEGIYPKPELTWSTNPEPNKEPLYNQTEEQLYSISSSLNLSDNDLNCSCTVSTRRNTWRATLVKVPSISVPDTETTILCVIPNTTQWSLMWRFNHSQVILNQSAAGDQDSVSNEWRQHVKDTSESGKLILQDLSLTHAGIYTCEVSYPDNTIITQRNVIIKKHQESSHVVVGIVCGVLGCTVLFALVFYFWKKYKEKQSRDNEMTQNNKAEMEPMKTRNS